jgi:GT2 family glycosyltransferase
MSGPSVDVVILTWNDGDLLEAAIRSVEDSASVAVDLVVVDNASSPPATSAAHLPITWIRNPENRGVAAARNQGAAAGQAPYVCFLDSDARLLPDALHQLVATLEAHPEVGLAAPTFVDQGASDSAGPAPTLGRKVLRAANLSGSYAAGERFADGVRQVDFAIGACQLIRRRAFDHVGGLDEGYFYGPEDVDFCLRLREAGWQIVQVERATVHHPPRRRFRGLVTRRGLQHARAVLRHLWRHRGFQRRVGRVPA